MCTDIWSCLVTDFNGTIKGMYSVVSEEITTKSLQETIDTGERIGNKLTGGEVIELTGDIGSGKTAFVRGLAIGMDSSDQVMSPTFTISRIYTSKNLELHHFDFYRLTDTGVVGAELSESINNPDVAVAIEWSKAVEDVLPEGRLQVSIVAVDEEERTLSFNAFDNKHAKLLGDLR